MSKPKFRQVLRYKFDNFIAKGGGSIFISLVIVFLIAVITIGSLRAFLFQMHPDGVTDPGLNSLGKSIWGTFVQFTDPGSMYYDNDSATEFKLTAILTGISGVIMMSMVIAVLTTALDRKLAFLRKGHSKVIEKNHTLILGWNERIVEILRELILANESQRNPSVVILSEQDKEIMDDYLNNHIKQRANTRIITRSGNTALLQDLERVAIDSCKSVIVLASCSDSASAQAKAESDARIIKSVLAIDASREDKKDLSIVSEIFEDPNRSVVENIAPGIVTTIDSREILAKILVQTSRSSGLAVVYGELLSFAGCEIYLHQTNWHNIKFGEAQYHFEDGVPIGIRAKDGSVKINPPSDTILDENDSIVIIANDDSTVSFNPKAITNPSDYPLSSDKLEIQQGKNLLIGWNSKAAIFIKELAQYVSDDSVVDIVLNNPDQAIRHEIEDLQNNHSNINIKLLELNPFDKQELTTLNPFSYNDIIILSQSGGSTEPEKTDSETIIILLLLREIFAENPDKSSQTQLITEVMNSENQDLISRAGVNDFIISNRFVSNILAQISEQPTIKTIYDDLFKENGSEIYLKPVSLYFKQMPKQVIFSDLMAIASKRNEICIGIRIGKQANNPNDNFGVELVPDKNKTYALNGDDYLIVVAENEL